MRGVVPSFTDAPIGTATLANIDHQHGSGEIGLMIGKKADWGKGASTEAMRLVIEFAFDTLD